MPGDFIFAVWSPKHKAYLQGTKWVALPEATHYTNGEQALHACPNNCAVRAFKITEISMKAARFTMPKEDA